MALKVSAGRIIRHGLTNLTPTQQIYLLENKEEVNRITKEIEERRAVFLKVEADTTARVVAADKAEADLELREAKLTDDRDALDTSTAAAEADRRAGMDALARRTREVEVREGAANDRTVALDEREQAIEDHGRSREDELRAREESIEAQEAAGEERATEQHQRSRDLNEQETRLTTVGKMVKQAVAPLG